MLIFLGLAPALVPAHRLSDVRELGLPPHVILEIFLPVMLFWETRNTSWREVRTRLRNEGKIDMNVLHAVQERLDVEEIRIIGPVELD